MLSGPKPIVLSTAGAIPVKNEKGQVTMEKVKVARYVTGKRPGYAPRLSDEEEEEEDAFPLKQRGQDLEAGNENEEGEEDTMAQKMIEDQKIRQIIESRNRMQSDGEEEGKDSEEARIAKHRRVVDAMDGRDDDDDRRRPDGAVMSDDEAELSDEEIARRREMLKRRALSMKIDKELLEDGERGAMEEKEEAEEESEYEECTDSESDGENLRLKPVFVRKEDRITIHERERALQKEKDQEYEQKRITHERRQETLKMLEVEIRGELEAKSQGKKDIDELDTEDENEEEAYEAWRVRELKRLKLDKEERERYEKEKQEVERLHNMTEEGRKRELKLNPKVVTNKAAKGKYKFLQKYYHRGVFYLDKEDSIFKRDYTAPTLEDRFNKTVLPKVMQVKNFGRSRRTKYTHLDDQDTTQFNSPWMSDTATNLKFHTTKGGGMKQNINAQRPKRY